MNQHYLMDKKFTPAQKIAKESTISFVGMGYGQLVRYLFTALLARLVGVHYLGLYSLGSSITNITSVIGKAGMDIGIMRYVSMRDLKKDRESIKIDILSTLKIGFVLSIIIMLIQILLADWLVESVFHESLLLRNILIIFAISIPFTTMMIIMVFATQGFQLLKYKVFVESILNPTILIISMIFIYYAFSSELAIILPTLLTAIISFIVATYILKKIVNINILNIISARFNKEIINYSLPIMFTMVLGSLLHWMDVLMLGYFLDAETVGLYHPAARTAGLQQSILIAFTGIFAPMFSRYYAQNDLGGMNHIYKLVSRWVLTLIIPVLMLIIMFPTKIMLLFGADFMQSSSVLILLAIGTSIFAIFGISSTALVVSGFQKVNLANNLLVTVLNVFLNIILIPKHGIAGAAWATLSSMTLLAVARLIEAWIYLKVIPFNLKIFKPIIAGILTYAILLYIRPNLMVYHTIITLLLALLIIFIVYGLSLLLFKFDKDDKDFLFSLIFLKNKVIKSTNRK